jgi:hypothetical protein
MNFQLFAKGSKNPTSGLPINLMMQVLQEVDSFLKAEGKPSTVDAVMGTGALVLVEGATAALGKDCVCLPLKKHMMLDLRRGQQGEASFPDGSTLYVGVTKTGDFLYGPTPLDPKSFESVADQFDKTSTKGQVFAWLETGERGMSSEALCAHLGEQAGVGPMGIAQRSKGDRHAHPHDPSDFRRCALFFEAVPNLKPLLPAMKSVSPEWNALVDAWPNLETLYAEEKDQKSAPKLYAEMQRVLMSARVQHNAQPSSSLKPS